MNLQTVVENEARADYAGVRRCCFATAGCDVIGRKSREKATAALIPSWKGAERARGDCGRHNRY